GKLKKFFQLFQSLAAHAAASSHLHQKRQANAGSEGVEIPPGELCGGGVAVLVQHLLVQLRSLVSVAQTALDIGELVEGVGLLRWPGYWLITWAKALPALSR